MTKLTAQLLIFCQLLHFSSIARSESKVYRNRLIDRPANQSKENTPPNVFYVSPEPGVTLMPVNVIGAVKQPGLYYVPMKSDITSVLAYAGGPTEKAILEDSTLSRLVGEKEEIEKIDLEKYYAERKGVRSSVIQPNDTIFIPAAQEIVALNTLRIVSIVSASLSIILSAILIYEHAK